MEGSAVPIYEFFSPDSGKVYSFLAKSIVYADCIPRCPDDPEYRMQRVISGFSIGGATKGLEGEGSGFGGEGDDPRMVSALEEMEREVSQMDEENPDPRQIGRLVRRISELSGEKVPESVEEMIKRLEGGEDPEKLEEEFGDLLDEEMADEDGEIPNAAGAGETPARRQRSPCRDPNLYDMESYL